MQPPSHPADRSLQDRLDSWKAIAAYLKRDVTTVQRWERREGMPVHRHLHDKQGSVYAFRSELDAWVQGRRAGVAQEEESQTQLAGQSDIAPRAPAGKAVPLAVQRVSAARRWWLPVGLAGALVAAAAGAYRLGVARDMFWRDPMASAEVTQLTDLSGTEQAAAISRDGQFVAFLAERDGHPDAWITKVGSSQYRNLTEGRVSELINSSIRTLGFSPDGRLVTIWSRKSEGSRAGDINILAAPAEGGSLQSYLPEAAEMAWSSDGRRLVYHTTAPGDPLFVKESLQSNPRRIYVAAAGVHCHFPVWSPNGAYVYFVRGVPPADWDIWRIRAAGDGLERITSHKALVSHPVLLDDRTLLYLASDTQRAGPWLFAMDVERRVPHRINFGLEHYTSLAASADGTRLVVTMAQLRSSLSRVSLATDASAGVTPTHVVPVAGPGRSPRLGADYVVYVASQGSRQSIWKLTNGASRHELWSTEHGSILGGPAIAPDGRHISFEVADGQRTVLFVMNSDGTGTKVVTDSLTLRGNPAWAPDGQSIVAAVVQGGEPRLMKIPVDGGAPLPLVSEYSLDPTWSPDGQFLLYSGPDVGTTFAVRAVAPDGRPYPLPALILSRGARRIVFWRDSHSIVVLRGEVSQKSFWVVDLQTGARRQLIDLAPGTEIGDFDISANGEEIVFDRAEQRSLVALIQRSP
jgi:Tol biopolymer transport system component